jgi:hypothetical protein
MASRRLFSVIMIVRSSVRTSPTSNRDMVSLWWGFGLVLVLVLVRFSVFGVRRNLERGIEKAVCRLWPTVSWRKSLGASFPKESSSRRIPSTGRQDNRPSLSSGHIAPREQPHASAPQLHPSRKDDWPAGHLQAPVEVAQGGELGRSIMVEGQQELVGFRLLSRNVVCSILSRQLSCSVTKAHVLIRKAVGIYRHTTRQREGCTHGD